MSTQHTPTPWVVSAPGIITSPKAMQDIGHVCYTGTDGGTDANAAFIVRACNAHDEMAAALREVRDLVHEESSDRAKFILGPNDDAEPYLSHPRAIKAYRIIRAALAKAGVP